MLERDGKESAGVGVRPDKEASKSEGAERAREPRLFSELGTEIGLPPENWSIGDGSESGKLVPNANQTMSSYSATGPHQVKTLRIGLIGDHDASVTAHRAIPIALALSRDAIGCACEWDWLHTSALLDAPPDQLG